jgi:multicomponent Na+:H+ antiporter subunit C
VSTFVLYSLLSAGLIAIGLHAVIVLDHLLRKVLALNVISSGIFLFIVAVAHRNADPDPDPVPHAMVLTGIVVAVSVTAFAVALIRRYHASSGRVVLHEEEGLE